jgi:hypothetical protein
MGKFLRYTILSILLLASQNTFADEGFRDFEAGDTINFKWNQISRGAKNNSGNTSFFNFLFFVCYNNGVDSDCTAMWESPQIGVLKGTTLNLNESYKFDVKNVLDFYETKFPSEDINNGHFGIAFFAYKADGTGTLVNLFKHSMAKMKAASADLVFKSAGRSPEEILSAKTTFSLVPHN